MEDKKIPKRRNGYYYIEDTEYVSITKILGCLDKPALFFWGIQQAARLALKDPNLNEKEVFAGVTKISRDAANRGKGIHNVIELYDDGDFSQLERLVTEKQRGFIRAFISWLELHNPETLAKEVEVYSKKHGFAGRFDRVCKINGLTCLVDVKTGKNVYREVELQNIAYKTAIEELEIASIDKMFVLLLKEDGTFVFNETNAKLEDFLAVKKVFEWGKRKE